MPLDSLADLFVNRGLEHTPQEVVALDECWLYAWVCSAWKSDDPSDSCRYMLVYRSLYVKDTAPMYAPVSRLLLESERVDLLIRTVVEDDNMVFGRGEWMLVRLCTADFKPKLSDEKIRQIIRQASVSSELMIRP